MALLKNFRGTGFIDWFDMSKMGLYLVELLIMTEIPLRVRSKHIFFPALTGDFSVTVKACYNEAKDAGKTFFAVQFYGECWASDDEKFRDYGQATNCYNGVGTQWSNYAYKIRV